MEGEVLAGRNEREHERGAVKERRKWYVCEWGRGEESACTHRESSSTHLSAKPLLPKTATTLFLKTAPIPVLFIHSLFSLTTSGTLPRKIRR